MFVFTVVVCWLAPLIAGTVLWIVGESLNWRWTHRPLTLRRAKKIVDRAVTTAISDMELATQGIRIQRGRW